MRKIEEKDGALSVSYELSGKEESLPADAVLIATGRHPETQGLLPMEADMERGFFKVNEHFETSVPGIYAIGDIVYGGIQLAHAAEAEGKAAAAAIAGKERAIDMAWCPSASTPFRKSQRLEFPKIRPKRWSFIQDKPGGHGQQCQKSHRR